MNIILDSDPAPQGAGSEHDAGARYTGTTKSRNEEMRNEKRKRRNGKWKRETQRRNEFSVGSSFVKYKRLCADAERTACACQLIQLNSHVSLTSMPWYWYIMYLAIG